MLYTNSNGLVTCQTIQYPLKKQDFLKKSATNYS